MTSYSHFQAKESALSLEKDLGKYISKKESLDDVVSQKNQEIKSLKDKLDIETEEKKKFQNQIRNLDEKLAQKNLQITDLTTVNENLESALIKQKKILSNSDFQNGIIFKFDKKI